MKKNKNINACLFLIISSFLFTSCQTDDTLEIDPQNNIPNFENYHYSTMHYPGFILLSNTSGIVKIEYDNQNRPVKRIGGMAALPASVGYTHMFSNDYKEEIVYGNNEISLFVKFSEPYNTSLLKTVFKTENGKIIRKVEVNVNSPSANDTINYYYNNDRLVRSYRKRKFPVSESTYYYNSIGNVDSIVARPFAYDAPTQTWEVDHITKFRTVEYFKDFDNSVNTTKN